ncbi:MAG: ribonuclease HII [Spirulinaceae cyanobacterium]
MSAHQLVAGVDEVGRGALFGPVVAAVVVTSPPILVELAALGVKDSKQLSAKKRSELVVEIQKLALDYQIGSATAQEIDSINILQASLLAMKRAVEQLKITPELCLIDGRYKIPGLELPQKTIIKGDRHSIAIAAASILAKVWRDRLIIDLAQQYPEYSLENHKGYPTKQHRLALQKYGLSVEHRQSFRPCQIAKIKDKNKH